jgi:spore maturation protein SpmA
MALNYVWIFFFIAGFVISIGKWLIDGDITVIPAVVNSTFENAKAAFEISIGLTGVMTLWLGLMKIGEKAGFIQILSKLIGPFFTRIFPEVPQDHPALGSIMMNYSANMLGLDNAATPLGIKAMEELQELNPNKDTASNAQIMFLVLNTAGFTIIPISIIAYRTQMHAASPTDVFLPLLIATYGATIIGLITVAIYQKINLFNRVIMAYLGGLIALLVGMVYLFKQMPSEQLNVVSGLVANITIFSIIIGFIVMAMMKKINVYETFIDGAKEGFVTSVKIIPYLVAMLVAIGVFRTAGGMDLITSFIAYMAQLIGLNTDFVPALPTGLMKPFSGSGARGLMLDCMKTSGVDSFAGKLACTFNGSSDTTFYILALYFGSVGIKNTRYAIIPALIADVASIILSILLAYLFFA